MNLSKTVLRKKQATTAFFIILSGLAIFFIFNLNHPQSLQKLEINGTMIDIEIAAGIKQKTKGLSGRNDLQEKQGMLFAYDKPQIISIWMKNMLFSIDIVWIDENFKIIHIENNVQPDSFPKIFSSPKPAKYVLEVNAGFAAKNNIKIGDEIKLR